MIKGRSGTIKVCYLTEIKPGHLMAGALWVDRTAYPRQPLFNAETDGCLPMAVILAESHDQGESWSPWREVPMPADIGPPSLTNPILIFNNNALAMSVETNKTYLDSAAWNQRVVLCHSADQGLTWGAPVTSGFDPTGRIFNFDQRVAVNSDGLIGAFLWTYDYEVNAYRNIHRRISEDDGHTWTEAEDLGFADQPSHPAILPDGRTVLAWVDRFDTQTIRARLAPSIDGHFDAESEMIIHTHSDATPEDVNTAGALGGSVWSFGLPYAETLPSGDVLVLFYAGTEAAMDVRYVRLEV